MIITKEHQEAMVNNYRKEGHNEFECMGFIDGMNKMFELITDFIEGFILYLIR